VVIGLNVVGAALFFAERRRRESVIARSAE
jgi:hypothetical protein